MYTSFFGLNEKAFSITPDPRYLYLSSLHADGLAHLLYGVSESGGFIQLTGEVGTGKTTLVRSLLERLPDDADVAFILNPQLSAREFLQAVCDELGAPAARDRNSVKELVDALNFQLLETHANGKRTILIVDEAQNLAADVLEQVRLLTNLETAKQKLLQIIFIGQPELRQTLRREDLRQLAQRITSRFHLEPLSRSDSIKYLRHRLRVAGATREVFTPGAMKEIHRQSGGIPRLMNIIADRALLAAYAQEKSVVSRRLARRAAREVRGHVSMSPWQTWLIAALGAAGLLVVAGGLWQVYRAPDTGERQPAVSVAPAAGEAQKAPPPAAGEPVSALQRRRPNPIPTSSASSVLRRAAA